MDPLLAVRLAPAAGLYKGEFAAGRETDRQPEPSSRDNGFGQVDQEFGALGIAARQFQLPAMPAHQFGGDGQP